MNALAKKLLIKPNTSWWFYNLPEECLNLLYPLPEGLAAHFEFTPGVDGILFFSKKRAEFTQQIILIKPLIKDDTVVWVCYPKKSSGIETDLAMGQWDMLTDAGLDAVANAAFNDSWTSVRIRHLGQRKKSGICVDEIRGNEYAAYVDVDNKVITLPPDAATALEAVPDALQLFNNLAYSHKKEYVLWILTAKQQKTRDDRLGKMVEMLLAKKKNPSDK